MIKHLLTFIFLCVTCITLSAQTLIFDDQTVYRYQTSKGLTRDSFDIDITNCSSVTASFDFEFGLPWLGNGNMEYNTECHAFGPCDGDPYNPVQEGCENCWDFLYAEFYIDGVLVYTRLIGGPDTDDNDQYGTISLDEFCVSENTDLHIKIWTQTWAADEWVEFTNIQVLCWDDMPEVDAVPNPVCENEDVQITTTTGTDFSPWNWTGPGGYTSTDKNPLIQNVTGTNAGTYFLNVTDVNSCPIERSVDITVHPFPTLPDYGPYCLTDPQVFLDGAPGGIAGSWSGPGVMGNLFNPANAGVGTHTLIFETWPQGCQGTIDVEVQDGGNLNPPALPQDLCEDDAPINLPGTISSVDGTWSGPGVSGNVFDPAAAGGGTHTLTFTPTNNDCVNPLTVQIPVNTTPTANNPAAIDACDDGSPIDLTEVNAEITGGGGGLTVKWYQDAGLTNEINNPGAYIPGSTTVYAVVNNGNCSSVAVSLTINLIDDVDIFPINPIEKCGDENGNVTINLMDYDSQLNGNSGNPVGWYSDVGLTTPINNPGNYTTNGGTVYAVVSNSVCTSDAQPVVITVLPAPTGTSASMAMCATGGAVIFNLTGLEDEIYSGGTDFTWFEDSDTTQLIPNPGSYSTTPPTTVYAVFTDGCRSVPVEVSLSVTDDVELGELDDIDICVGMELWLEGPDISGMTFLWEGPNGFTSTERVVLVSSNAGMNHAGVYTLTGTIDDCEDTESLTVTVHDAPDLSLDVIFDISCAGAADGAIEVIYQGSGNPIDYTWSNPVYNGQSEIYNLGAGVYSVTVTDDNGCEASANITLTEPEELMLTCSLLTGLSGPGAEDAQAEVFVGGGTAPYVLSWTGAATGDEFYMVNGVYIISNLPEGIIVFTLTDAYGCSVICTLVIPSVDCDITATINQTADILCFGDATAAIQVQVQGGNGALTYTWNDSQYDGESELSGLPAGSYSVTVEDEGGCLAFANINITQPAELVLNCTLAKEISGEGADDAEVEISLSGGAAPYTVSWTGAANGNESYGAAGTYTITDLPEGTINITLIDANGCTAECTVTIPSLDCDITVTITQTEEILCYGDENAAIELMVEGAYGALTYVWNDSDYDGEKDLSYLSAGTYTVTVTDEGDCSATATITITQPDELILVCSVLNDESDLGAKDGLANLHISGGTEPYMTMTWNGPGGGGTIPDPQAGDNQLTDLGTGDYFVSLTDANGCSSTCIFTIASAECDLSIDVILQDTLKCHGDNNASLLVIVTNGVEPYEVSWSVSGLGETLNPQNLGAGQYSVAVIDANGCEDFMTIVIEEPDPIDFSCSAKDKPSDKDAEDGSVSLDLSGGVPPYTLTYTGPSSGSMNDVNFPLDIENLKSGNYTFTVTDANGCVTVCSLVLNPEGCDLVVELELDDKILCHGDASASIIVNSNATGVLQFVWNKSELDGKANPKNLGPGTYSLTITDEFGCSASDEITITEPEPLVLICTAGDGPHNDNTVELQIGGGTPSYGYTLTGQASIAGTYLMGGTFIIDDLDEGDYKIVIVDANGCTVECYFTIKAFECKLELSEESADVTCHGANDGYIYLSIDSAYLTTGIIWNNSAYNGMDTLRNLGPGIYSVTVTDEADCKDSLTVEITEFPLLEVTCNTGLTPETITTVEITMEGGNPGYTYRITTSSGTLIEEGQANSGDVFTYDDLDDDEYIVTIIDQNGCEVSCEFRISTFSCELEVIESHTGVSCYGDSDGSINLTIDGNFGDVVIEWNNPQYNGMDALVDLAPGTYSVTVTDEAGCTVSLVIAISEPSPTEVTIAGPDFICENETIFLEVVDTFATYIWNGVNGSSRQEILQGGLVTVEVINANGCSAFDTLFVMPADTALIYIRDSLCADEQITVNGTIYNVNNPSGTEVVPGGSRDGCDSTIIVDLFFFGTVEIAVHEPSCGGLMQTEVEILEGGNAVLPIDVYYNGVYSETVNILPHRLVFPGPGNYSLRIVDDEGCTHTEDILVTAREPITARILSDSIVLAGDTINLTAQIDGPYRTFRWYPENVVDCDTCLSTFAVINETTVIILEVIDEFGCITTVTKMIVISEGTSVYVPNAFTPNFDGVNDRFIVQMGPNVIGMKSMGVFDRWGNRVYEEHYTTPTRNIIGWNGKYRNIDMNPGVFVYVVEVEIRPGRIQIFKGTLTLIR